MKRVPKLARGGTPAPWLFASRTGRHHVVFTVPSELRALAKHAPGELFGALFSAASATLIELGAAPATGPACSPGRRP